ITPHPGGLLRKAGRSPSDRPFVCLGSSHLQEAGTTGLIQGKFEEKLAFDRRGEEFPALTVQFEISQNAYLKKRNVTKSVTTSAKICIFASYGRMRPC